MRYKVWDNGVLRLRHVYQNAKKNTDSYVGKVHNRPQLYKKLKFCTIKEHNKNIEQSIKPTKDVEYSPSKLNQPTTSKNMKNLVY